MPNSLGTIQAGKVVTQRMLELLLAQFPLLRTVAHDLSSDQIKWGETVFVKKRGTFTAQDFDPATGYEPQNITMGDFPVTLNQHKHVTIALNDHELTSTDLDIIDAHAEPAAHALGKAIYDDLFGLVKVADFPNESVIALNAYDRDTAADIAKALNDREIPDVRRYVMIGNAYANSLEKDLNVIANFSHDNPLLNDGKLPRISGLQHWRYTMLPHNGEYLTGIAGHPDSLAFAARVPKMPRAGVGYTGTIEIVTDAKTGLSVQRRHWYDIKLGKEISVVTMMYGVGKGEPKALQRLVSQASA
jgi:hypothetical protein